MNIKINILRTILVIGLIIMFTTIFGFSNQNGEESGSLSREITENVTKNLKAIQQLEKTKKEQLLGKIEHLIRKLAHFSLYTIIGILTMSLMSTYSLKQLKRTYISLGVGVLYAVSDELHQLFITDRTASIVDVLIDSCGVIVGIGITLIVLKILKKLIKINHNSYKEQA